MRLCVNQKGERQDVDVLGDHVFDTNILTVIASESYDELKTGSLTKIIKCALINEKMYIQLECDGEIYWIKALENPPIADNERQFMEVRYAG